MTGIKEWKKVVITAYKRRLILYVNFRKTGSPRNEPITISLTKIWQDHQELIIFHHLIHDVISRKNTIFGSILKNVTTGGLLIQKEDSWIPEAAGISGPRRILHVQIDREQSDPAPPPPRGEGVAHLVRITHLSVTSRAAEYWPPSLDRSWLRPWGWSLNAIHGPGNIGNVVSMLVHRLHRWTNVDTWSSYY